MRADTILTMNAKNVAEERGGAIASEILKLLADYEEACERSMLPCCDKQNEYELKSHELHRLLVNVLRKYQT